ncbi:hypothetical protein [Limibacterium fermenti]|uniref:hypothetical protein n=1 Tax=Limibacterium fermenti TaxID=3229863 RepID=UPI003A6D8B0A
MINKPKSKTKKGCLITFLIVTIIIIISTLIPNNDNKKQDLVKDDIKSSEKSEEQLNSDLKAQLEREIKSIKEGVDFSSYSGTVESLQSELILFNMWGIVIGKGENSIDEEIKGLAAQLKNDVIQLQIKEFPILRHKYADILNKKMWEHDIEVSASGDKSKYLNLTGGIFAANKNKKEYQETIQEALMMFRFSQSRYRWYKGEDEYTYWSIYEGKDSDMVTFE